MKNTKKLLALVLVLTMVLVMVPFSAGATTFDDDDEINYGEAVDVLTAIRAIGGYSDGTFRPDRPVTRAEAAAMIARMLLGRDVADSLPAAVSFPDVPANSMYAGYISYCAAEGIIVGVGGRFYPNNNVTGVQLAIMLLRALGLSDDPGRYSGGTGSMYAILDGMKFGILTTDVDYTQPATREQTAQYIFNALDYSETTVTQTVTRYLVSGADTATATSLAEALDSPIGKLFDSIADAVAAVVILESTAVLGRDYTITPITATEDIKVGSVGDLVYKLRKTFGNDVFGRPNVRTWFYNNRPIASTVIVAPVRTYTTRVTQATLYTDLGLIAGGSAKLIVDGKTSGSSQAINRGGQGQIGDSGNGVLTEVYRAVDGSLTIVQVNTYVGSIPTGGVYAATATRDAYISITANATYNPTEAAKTFAFETTGYSARDVVLYTAAWDADESDYIVQSVALADKQTLVATSAVTSAPRSFVADGKTYTYSAQSTNSVGSADVTNKVENTVYFDDYGYVIQVSAPLTLPNYAVVLAHNPVVEWGNTTYNTRLLLADNTISDVVTNSTGGAIPAGNIVTYAPGTGADAGKTVLTQRSTGSGNFAYGASSATITRNAVAFTAGGASRQGNAQTIFFVRQVPASGAPTYSVYTGISAVPSISGADNTAVYVAPQLNGDPGIFTTAVFIDTAILASSPQPTEVIYVNAASRVNATDDRGDFSTYNVVKGGVPGTIDTVRDLFGNVESVLLSSVSTNDKDLINGFTKLDEVGDITHVGGPVIGTGDAQFNAVRLGSTNLSYNNNTKVFTVGGPTGFEESTGAEIVEDTNDVVFYYATNNVLTAVYITATANTGLTRINSADLDTVAGVGTVADTETVEDAKITITGTGFEDVENYAEWKGPGVVPPAFSTGDVVLTVILRASNGYTFTGTDLVDTDFDAWSLTPTLTNYGNALVLVYEKTL